MYQVYSDGVTYGWLSFNDALDLAADKELENGYSAILNSKGETVLETWIPKLSV